MRHVAVAVAGIALVVGCAVWLVEQVPHPRPAATQGVSVRASPGAFDDGTWQSLRERPLDAPTGTCSAHGLTRGPVAAELLDISARLPDALWRWRVDDHYAGPVLVRGIEAGGRRVTFQLPGGQIFAGEAGEPVDGAGFPELMLVAPEYRYVPGAVSAWVEVRFPSPGCYRLQADGLGFQQAEVIEVS